VTVRFWRGRIAEAHTSPPVAYLGDVLCELGWLDVPTRDAALREAVTAKRRSGELFIEWGQVTPEQRDRALAEQACRRVQHVFSYPAEATFAFYDEPEAEEEPPLALDLLAPIWRGVSGKPPTASVEAVLARYDHARFRMVQGPPFEMVDFSLEEQALLAVLASRPLTLAEMRQRQSPRLPAGRIDVIAYLLLISKCVAPWTPSGNSMSAVAPSIPAPPPQSHTGKPGPPRSLTPPSMPSGERAAGRQEPPAKTEDKTSPSGPKDLGAAGIAEVAKGIQDVSYFELLGVSDGASDEAVRAAYVRLTKEWHPDRLPPTLESSRGHVQTIFVAMTRAFQTLTDPQARRGYLNTRAAAATAARHLRMDKIRFIEGALLKRDFDVAHTESRRLYDADADDVDALALMAWASAKAGEAPEAVLRASVAKLDAAVLGDRDCERAFYYRAMLHKRLGNGPLAHRDFQRVVQVNPKHVEAEREVRLFEMRRRDSGEHTSPKKK
jgi:hypothetical protein